MFLVLITITLALTANIEGKLNAKAKATPPHCTQVTKGEKTIVILTCIPL